MTNPPKDDSFNTFQQTAASYYADGTFAWILDEPNWRQRLQECGDPLFAFLIHELSGLAYPDDAPEALRLLQRAADDVEEVYDAIDALQHNDPAKRIFATFVPQVWINDHAVTVDPLGETNIDITRAVLAMTRQQALDLRDDTHETDFLLDRDTAQPWIRDWQGPYYLAVEAAIGRYFGTLTNPTGEPESKAAPAE